jgi:hypothetical protein
MKTSYTLLIFCLCLNLAAWGVEEADIFAGGTTFTPFDPSTEIAKFNITGDIDIFSAIPLGNEVRAVLTWIQRIQNIFIGFPLFIASIPYVPSWLSTVVGFLFIFIEGTFLFELFTGRDITGDYG